MMGLRGCRLGIVHPEISEMQVGQGLVFGVTGIVCPEISEM